MSQSLIEKVNPDYCETGNKQLLAKLQSQHPFPLAAVIVLTERCNLSCPHCYLPRPTERDELSTSRIKKLLVELADVGTLRLVLTGGEPMLRDDLNEIIQEAARQRFSITLKTNGSLITDETLKRLWQSGLGELTVSLYHKEPKEHDKFVGQSGAWEQAARVLNNSRKLGGRVSVAIIAMNWNTKSIPGLMDLCERHDWPYSLDSRIHGRTDGSHEPCCFQADEEALVELFTDSRFAKETPDLANTSNRVNTPVCGAALRMSCIMPNGDVWPCGSLPWSMGNVKEMSYREICQTSTLRQQVLSIRWQDSSKCSPCKLLNICSRCPAASYHHSGNINIPWPTDCKFARALSRASEKWKDNYFTR